MNDCRFAYSYRQPHFVVKSRLVVGTAAIFCYNFTHFWPHTLYLLLLFGRLLRFIPLAYYISYIYSGFLCYSDNDNESIV